MRLMQRGRVLVRWQGRAAQAALRPLESDLSARRYGEYGRESVRLLLPWNAQLSPGDRMEISGAPYVCTGVRLLAGHVQADARRCAR